MEFFEKVNTIAKTAAAKTGEVIEDTRLKTQILNDEKSIRELESKIGAHYYAKYAAGEFVDDEVEQYCIAISVHRKNIEEKKEALNAGKEPTYAQTPEDDFAEPGEIKDPEDLI